MWRPAMVMSDWTSRSGVSDCQPLSLALCASPLKLGQAQGPRRPPRKGRAAVSNTAP